MGTIVAVPPVRARFRRVEPHFARTQGHRHEQCGGWELLFCLDGARRFTTGAVPFVITAGQVRILRCVSDVPETCQPSSTSWSRPMCLWICLHASVGDDAPQGNHERSSTSGVARGVAMGHRVHAGHRATETATQWAGRVASIQIGTGRRVGSERIVVERSRRCRKECGYPFDQGTSSVRDTRTPFIAWPGATEGRGGVDGPQEDRQIRQQAVRSRWRHANRCTDGGGHTKGHPGQREIGAWVPRTFLHDCCQAGSALERGGFDPGHDGQDRPGGRNEGQSGVRGLMHATIPTTA